MPVLDVSLLGGFGLRFDDDPVPPIPSRVGRSLLALLVLHRDRPHARDRLAATFWPDLPEPQARRRLSHTLWQIQDVLGELPVDEPFLDVTSHAISIHRDAPIRVDAEVFAEGAERHRPEPGRPPDLTVLERVVDLYGGDLLAGYDDDWLVPDRARFQSLYLDALGWLVDAAKAQGVFEDALVYARRLTNHDPLREDAHREVMRLCMLLGRPPEALRQYERCRSVLAEELGAEPSRATVDLAEQIQQQRHAPSAPPVRVDPARLRLVGRDRERGVLVGELERALGGRTCHVLLEGPPGIGKSRLVDQVVEDARWRGFAVGRSVCDVGGGWPYLALAEALEDALTPIRVAQLRARVDPIWLNEIGRIIPQLRLGDPPAVLGPRESASRMQEAFVQVLVALVEMVPLTLIVEDVHHVDRETLLVLHRFLDRVRDRRCCIVLTYRSQEARDLPHAWDHLRALDAVAVPERLQLQPLTAFDVGELARELLPPPVGQDLVARLHADTGGNPLFVLETLRALGEHTAGHADVGGMPLPATIVDVVRDRVAALDPDVQAVLSTAAVQAVGVDLDTLAEALEGTADRLGEALHVLVGRSLLVETSEGYAFAHEQIRRVIVDMLDDDQRARLHRRVADALLQVHPDRQRDIARHLEAGGRVREAVGACRQAAAAAVALHAWRTALHDLDRAAHLQRQGPASVEQQIDLLLELEAVLDVVGERERQEAALDELAALVGDDRHGTTEVARRRAWMLAQTGRMDGGEEAAAQAVDTAPDGHARTAALTALGTIRSWLGDLPGARSALEDAIAAGVGSPDEAKARIALGDVYRIQQDHAAARDVLETAWSLYRQWQDPQGEVRALTALSSVHLETGRTDVALDRVAESIQTCRRIGYRQGEAVALVNQANAHYFDGAIGPALESYAQAASLFADLGDDRGVAMVRMNAATVRTKVLGDHAAAAPDAAAAVAFFERTSDRRMTASALDGLAATALLAGDSSGARDLLLRAQALVRDDGDVWVLAQVQRGLALVAFAEDDAEAAWAAADDGLSRCAGPGLGDVAVPLQAVRGLAAMRLGRVEEGLADTTAAVEDLTAGVEQAHLVWWWHAQCAEAAGRHDVAAHAIEQAHAALQRALAGVPEPLRQQALSDVADHARIVQAHEAARPRQVRARLADAAAPTGRPLVDAELREVVLTIDLSADADDPIEHRRGVLADLVDQAAQQGAIPTVDDLAEILDVSVSTVRRDLQALRERGLAVVTRGSRAS